MPALGKVTESVNAPVLSAWMLGSAVTLPSGPVSQVEIASFAVNPVPEKVTGVPIPTCVPVADAPLDGDVTGAPGTGAVVVLDAVPTV